MSDSGDREFEVFNATRQLPSAERAAYLDKTCAGDPAMRQRLEALLKAGEQAASFMDNPAAQPAGPGSQVPPEPADLAAHFPHLEIIELIGMGGMGTVYKARQPKLDRFVALKILAVASDAGEGFGERFLREARALARLSHPGIVAVYDFGQTANYYFLVMEYVDGMNLRQLLKSTTVTSHEALDLVMQVCGALQYAHDHKVIHRDIKPENILITKEGQVKIADFGLAKLMGGTDTNLTQSQTLMGTLNYMAPEQREKPLEVDHRADIYSLGVVFYEMLTGEVPLGRFDPPSKKVQIDVRLDEVVLRALDREPSRRYQHASEVKTGLESITSSKPQSPRSTANKVAWVTLLAAMIGIVLGVMHRKPAPAAAKPATANVKPATAEVKPAVATDPAADYQRGYNYEHGIGSLQDYAEAAKCYRRAAEAGLGRAQNSLGALYEHGFGVDQDYSDALYWYRKAAKAGLADAIVNTGRLDDLQSPGDSGRDLESAFKTAAGDGVPKDPVKATELFRKAAEAGNALGEFWLAESYMNGGGVRRDYAEGANWHRKSAETGNAQGEDGYAYDLEIGRGVAQNYAEAAKWYRKSAEAGFALAQISLGNLYENGLGVEKSDDEAAHWYRMAANAGDADGRARSARLVAATSATPAVRVSGEIHDAARNGDLATVQALLKEKPELISSRDGEGDTPLLWAACRNQQAVVEFLLAKKADADAKDNDGLGPLHWAAQRGYKEVVAMLLASNAAINAKDNEGDTPLLWAACKDHKDVVELLLASNAVIEAKDKDGLTPLHWAAERGYNDVVEVLLSSNAVVDARDNQSMTPLHWAARNGYPEMAKLLLNNKADINARDHYGLTPLHWAASGDYKNVAEVLLAHGADVNAKDKQGWAPLRGAIHKGYDDMAALLRQSGGHD